MFYNQVVEMQFRSSSRIIDSEGPVGRKTKASFYLYARVTQNIMRHFVGKVGVP